MLSVREIQFGADFAHKPLCARVACKEVHLCHFVTDQGDRNPANFFEGMAVFTIRKRNRPTLEGVRRLATGLIPVLWGGTGKSPDASGQAASGFSVPTVTSSVISSPLRSSVTVEVAFGSVVATARVRSRRSITSLSPKERMMSPF